jgi:hypothetical protein
MRGANFEHCSEGSLQVTSDLGARVLADPALAGTVGLKIKFARQGAVYLRAIDCALEEMADQDLVGSEIVQRSLGGFWADDDIVITEIVRCSAFTLIISGGAGASIELAVRMDVLPTTGAALHAVESTNVTTKIIGEQGLIPFFRCRSLRRRLLGVGDPVFRSGEASGAPQGPKRSIDDQWPYLAPDAPPSD